MNRHWIWLVTLACACASPAPSGESSTSALPVGVIHEPFTRYLEISAGGETLGYLLRYDPIPLHSDAERAFPTGSHRILDLAFEDVGFITRSGEFRRHTVAGHSESIGHHELFEGLQEYFGSTAAVKLTPIYQP